jgi:hypothetical protein
MGRHKTTRRGRKKPKMPKTQIDERPLLVVTSLGNSILERNSLVFVKVGKNTFARKAAEDLREGEKIIFEKEGINVQERIKEINGLLTQGRRYRNAMASLFVETSQGYTTRFRAELIGGAFGNPLWPNELSSQAQLLEMMMRNGNELLELAAETIHVELTRKLIGAKPVTLEHIRNGWLTGAVIAPRNFKEVFVALGKLSCGLSKLAGTPEFKRHYHVYLAMKESIIQSLNNEMCETGNKRSDTKKRSLGSKWLGPEERAELDEIRKFFAEDLNVKYAIASVVSTKPIKPVLRSEVERNKERLRKGIVTKKPEDFDFQVISPVESEKRVVIIQDLMNETLKIFLPRQYPEHLENQYFKEHILDIVIGYLQEKLGYEGFMDRVERDIERMKKAGIETAGFEKEFLDHNLHAQGKRYAQEIYSMALNGTMDKEFDLEPGSFLKLFRELANRLASSSEDGEYITTLNRLKNFYSRGGKDTRKIREEKEATQKKIDKTGLKNSFMTSRQVYYNAVHQLGGMQEVIKRGITTQKEYVTVQISLDEEKIDEIADKIYNNLNKFNRKGRFSFPENQRIRAKEKQRILKEMDLVEVNRRIMKELASIFHDNLLKQKDGAQS